MSFYWLHIASFLSLFFSFVLTFLLFFLLSFHSTWQVHQNKVWRSIPEDFIGPKSTSSSESVMQMSQQRFLLALHFPKIVELAELWKSGVQSTGNTGSPSQRNGNLFQVEGERVKERERTMVLLLIRPVKAGAPQIAKPHSGKAGKKRGLQDEWGMRSSRCCCYILDRKMKASRHSLPVFTLISTMIGRRGHGQIHKCGVTQIWHRSGWAGPLCTIDHRRDCNIIPHRPSGLCTDII